MPFSLEVRALTRTRLHCRASRAPGVGSCRATRRPQPPHARPASAWSPSAAAFRLATLPGERRHHFFRGTALETSAACADSQELHRWSSFLHLDYARCMSVLPCCTASLQSRVQSGHRCTGTAVTRLPPCSQYTRTSSTLARIPDRDEPDIPFCGIQTSRARLHSFSSQQQPSVTKLSRKGFSVLRASILWGSRKLDFFVSGVSPDGAKEGEKSAMSAVDAVKELQPDLVLLGLGYLDREKIFETFSRDSLLRSMEIEPVDQVLLRDNGQFIPTLQHLTIHGIPYYVVGRDRLVEMGALGRELLWRPLEVYSLLWKLIRSQKEKESLTPSLKKVLSEESSEFCFLKIHQYLLGWTESKFSSSEPFRGFVETKFTEKWLVGRNKSECQLRIRAKQFEAARLPIPAGLKSKPNWRILIVCDVALEDRLAERLSRDLPRVREERPRFERMFELENTSSTRFHLCLMIYLILPVVTLGRVLWKLGKKAYFEYWVKGSTVSVSGDEVLSRLGDHASMGTNAHDRKKENLEVVEARWLGLKHSVRDKSRD